MNSGGWDYRILLEKGCALWRQGDDKEGNGALQQACLLWLDELEREDVSHAPTVSDQLIAAMTAMLERLGMSDMAGAADVLEYDILPLLPAPEKAPTEGAP